jgi:hypothetical protein
MKFSRFYVAWNMTTVFTWACSRTLF